MFRLCGAWILPAIAYIPQIMDILCWQETKLSRLTNSRYALCVFLSNSTAIPRRWHCDLTFLRAPWDRAKILENKANNFTFSKACRCHRVATKTVAFLRSTHGAPRRSHGVLVDDWLCGHGALMACSWRAKNCHCASTACAQRARSVQFVSTASTRSVYERLRKSQQAYCAEIWCIFQSS